MNELNSLIEWITRWHEATTVKGRVCVSEEIGGAAKAWRKANEKKGDRVIHSYPGTAIDDIRRGDRVMIKHTKGKFRLRF